MANYLVSGGLGENSFMRISLVPVLDPSGGGSTLHSTLDKIRSSVTLSLIPF